MAGARITNGPQKLKSVVVVVLGLHLGSASERQGPNALRHALNDKRYDVNALFVEQIR